MKLEILKTILLWSRYTTPITCCTHSLIRGVRFHGRYVFMNLQDCGKLHSVLPNLSFSALKVGINIDGMSPFLKVDSKLTNSCSEAIQIGPERADITGANGFCRAERVPVFHMVKVTAPHAQMLCWSLV